MSKAMLIMDMPECCADCTIMEDDPADSYCIGHNGDCIDIPDTMGGKPDWCPLQELPEKKNYIVLPEESPLNAWINGWNACLDAIHLRDETGGQENNG